MKKLAKYVFLNYSTYFTVVSSITEKISTSSVTVVTDNTPAIGSSVVINNTLRDAHRTRHAFGMGNKTGIRNYGMRI